MAAKILQFISKATLLQLRGQRNYSRFMQLTKGLVAPNSPERLGWKRESAEEDVRDAEWNQRHGKIDGGAAILRFDSPVERAKINENESRVRS